MATREGSDLERALEDALAGGPERHHRKTAEQGKLPVRERVARLVDAESFAEEALLAWSIRSRSRKRACSPTGTPRGSGPTAS